MLDHMVIENRVKRLVGIVHRAGVAQPNMVALGLQVVHFGIKFHIEPLDIGRQRMRQVKHLFARSSTPDD